MTETIPGRYCVEATDRPTPAVTAAVATFLADRDTTLTDLVAGRSLEDVYFEAVGAGAASTYDDPAEPTRRRRSRRGKRRA